MDLRRIVLSGIAFISFFFSLTTSAATVIDNNAPIVSLRTTCTEAGGSVFINNCFTDLATLTNWIFNVRNPAPSVDSPVLVEIGPGQFNGSFLCSDSGYVTLRGSGMQSTIINAAIYPVAITNCKNMTFMNMTLKTASLGVQGGGSVSFWHDVEIDAGGFYAWFDSGANGACYGPKGKHYWFNSRITGRGTSPGSTAYQSACDESWFFGSEITKVASGTAGSEYAVTSLKKRGETHIYGGVVRVISQGTASATTLVAIHAENTGIVHVHGTGIDAIGSGANPVVALSAITNGEIHGNQAAYNLSTGAGGTVTRILNNGGHVHAPYVWQEHPQPPSINSQNGADMIVQTGCAANGCQNAGTETHLLIYNTNCTGTGGPWFDVVTRACR